MSEINDTQPPRSLRENESLRRQVDELSSLNLLSRSVIDSLPDLIMFKDAGLRYRLVNEAFRSYVGKTDADILGRTDFDLFPRDKAEQYRREDEAVITADAPERREMRVAGKEEWVEETKVPVRRDDGGLVGIYVKIRDVTEHVLASRAETQQRVIRSLRQVTDTVPCVIHQTTMTPENVPVFSFVSAGVKELYGVDPEEVVEDANTLFQYVHQDDAEMVGNHLQRAFSNESSWRMTYRIVGPDGNQKWIESSATPQRDDQGRLVWNGFSVDVSDRKKAEELREDIERITRHDMKTPLSSIVMMAKYLSSDKSLDSKHADMAAVIDRAAGKMRDLINESLNLYRMEQGTYELTRSEIDMVALVDEVANDLESLKKRKRVEIRRIDDGGEFLAQGEELLLYSMMANLLKNAVEASPPKETVTVNFHRGADGWLNMDIHNLGMVPEEIRERFFEKYATSGKSRGTGIGTYSAKLIADVHGGTLRMRSDQTSGTTITVVLPS